MAPVRVPIVVCVSSFDAGGTERQMVELIRGLDKSTYEVHAACFAARGPWLSTVEACAASVEEYRIAGFHRPVTWRLIRRFARWCREHQIQTVLTSDFYSNIFGLVGGAIAGVPVRIGGRRELVTDKTLPKLLLQRAAYAAAHRIVANSQAAAACLRREGVPPARIVVLPNCIRADEFANPRSRRAMTRAVTVANLRAEKGHDILIDAIALRRPELAGMHFQFVGNGPCRDTLERRVHERGLQGCVEFLGERGDIPQILAEADLFILPSLTEAFPNSVMEAMASGLPVIASAVGGVVELIRDGSSGLLVRPGDPRALSEAIVALASNPDLAHALGYEARAAIQTGYSTRAMVSAFANLTESELDRRLSPKRKQALLNSEF